MLNQCQFIGHLGKDPEARTTQNGVKVVNISLGVSRKWKDSNGDQKEQTEWVRGIIWGSSKGDGLAGVVERFCSKGSKLFIQGRMETRKWQDKDGCDRYSTEIVVSDVELLDGKQSSGSSDIGSTGNGSSNGWDSPADLDDSIPF